MPRSRSGGSRRRRCRSPRSGARSPGPQHAPARWWYRTRRRRGRGSCWRGRSSGGPFLILLRATRFTANRSPLRRKTLPHQLRGFGWRPTCDIACQAPSSNTARPAASSMALQPITTSVGVTPLLRPNGRGAGPACALAANSRTTLANTCPSESSGMSPSRSASIASAQSAEISLASVSKDGAAWSDGDIDLSIAFDHVELLQPQPQVGDVVAVRQVELIAVPRTDDVHVGFVEGLAVEDAVLVDEFFHLRHAQALAGRAALVRAIVPVGVILALVADDPDLEFAGPHDAHPALGHFAVPAHQHFGHRPAPFDPIVMIPYHMVPYN